MPAFHVKRTIRIAAAEEKLRPAIEDFGEWPIWSPWLCMEPEAKVTVRGKPGTVGHGYDWQGDMVGAGDMEIVELGPSTIQMDLKFLKPFKSRAAVAMQVHAAGPDETDLTWEMDSSLPFFLFFMVPTMKSMIGMDYERGLRMLKEYVETGSVKSKITIEGIVDMPAIHYIGIQDNCAMQDIGPSMRQTMPAAAALLAQNNVERIGAPGAIYNAVDIKNQTCRYTAYMPVAAGIQVDGAVSGSVPAGRALKLVHTGSYENLGNAWSCAMAYSRHNKIKLRKGISGLEQYVNDSETTPPADLITELYLPLR